MGCNVYGTAVAFGEKGVLILGESGRGKSDLALRLIDSGASLVADDRVVLEVRQGRLLASCPPEIKGLLEIRGLGIFELPCVENVGISCAVRSCAELEEPERLPGARSETVHGLDIPLIHVPFLEPSAPAKIKAALFFRRLDL